MSDAKMLLCGVAIGSLVYGNDGITAVALVVLLVLEFLTGDFYE